MQKVPELSGHSYCRNPSPSTRQTILCWTAESHIENCNPKVPSISGTTVHTMSVLPRMLWNTIAVTSNSSVRFVRYVSPKGNCRFTRMEVTGRLVAPASGCKVAVRSVRREPGPEIRMDLARPAWHSGRAFEGFQETSSDWVSNSSLVVQ